MKLKELLEVLPIGNIVRFEVLEVTKPEWITVLDIPEKYPQFLEYEVMRVDVCDFIKRLNIEVSDSLGDFWEEEEK